MAIPFITIELDKPYQIRFGMGTQLEYEQLSGKTIPQLGNEMLTGLSATTLNKVLFVMLKKEIKDLTLEKTTELIDDYSNITYVTEKVCAAVNAAYETKLPNAETPEVQSLNG
jgi:hypothetical protein